MTGHGEGIRNSLKSVWPDVTLLLCIFHILQAVWRYIFSKDCGVPNDKRPDIFNKFKTCIYVKESDFATSTNVLFELPALTKIFLICGNAHQIGCEAFELFC